MSTRHIKKEDLHLGVEIGTGGFGTVFKATFNDQDVAVKQLNKPDKHEVDILKTLDHPHIVKFIGELEEEDTLYLVLEFCTGGSLRSYLNRKRFQKKLLPTYQVYNWAEQAIKPIRYLRTKHLVHKDIKSPNYLITDGNVLKLADFGLTKNIEKTIQNATQSGSPAWGAKELLKDNILSPSYDISAYGVILWELCTTLVPFEGSSSLHIIWRICMNNERPAIPANCPKPLADLMRKCWELDWQKRPNPDEILQLLSLQQKTLIAGPWILEKVIGQQESEELIAPAAIAINPISQDVAVVDLIRNKFVVYCITGELNFRFDLKQLFPSLHTFPYMGDVAVSHVGNYYITIGTQFVYCFNQSGVHTSSWAAVSADNMLLDTRNSKLSGLAIDQTNNMLLVGVGSHNYISKHSLNGTHIKSIKVNITPSLLAMTSNATVIISDLQNVQILDQTGQVLHTIMPPLMRHWEPCSIYYHEGIIFICQYNTTQIACFSINGDYIGDIPVDDNPQCLTFVPGQKKFLVPLPSDGKVHMYSCLH